MKCTARWSTHDCSFEEGHIEHHRCTRNEVNPHYWKDEMRFQVPEPTVQPYEPDTDYQHMKRERDQLISERDFLREQLEIVLEEQKTTLRILAKLVESM